MEKVAVIRKYYVDEAGDATLFSAKGKLIVGSAMWIFSGLLFTWFTIWMIRARMHMVDITHKKSR